MATSGKDQQPPTTPCVLLEITQHICEVRNHKTPGQPPTIHCFPLPRILKICQGKPAIEITKEVEIKKDGCVHIPPTLNETSIVGRPWKEVVRHDIEEINRKDKEYIAGVSPEA